MDVLSPHTNSLDQVTSTVPFQGTNTPPHHVRGSSLPRSQAWVGKANILGAENGSIQHSLSEGAAPKLRLDCSHIFLGWALWVLRLWNAPLETWGFT